jgi:hypothetical protein
MKRILNLLTWQELLAAVRWLKTKNTSGSDGIHIKALTQNLFSLLIRLSELLKMY